MFFFFLLLIILLVHLKQTKNWLKATTLTQKLQQNPASYRIFAVAGAASLPNVSMFMFDPKVYILRATFLSCGKGRLPNCSQNCKGTLPLFSHVLLTQGREFARATSFRQITSLFHSPYTHTHTHSKIGFSGYTFSSPLTSHLS